MEADTVRTLLARLREWAQEHLDNPTRELLAALLAPGIASFCPQPDGDGLLDWLPLPERVAAGPQPAHVSGLIDEQGR